jgi:large subunit ribosomal protein L29
MALSKGEEIRSLSDEEIQSEVIAAKRQLFDLRFQKATRQLEKHHQFKHVRHRLAQLMTIERERQIAAQATSKSKTVPLKSPNLQQPDTTTEE